MGQTPDITEVVDAVVDARQEDLYTAIPGIVTAYDATKQMATVQPSVKRYHLDETGERVSELLPAVAGVPVMFPGAGAYRITWPIAKGDFVLLIVANVSLDRWKAGRGEVTDPQHDGAGLNGAIAVPGLHPFGRVPTSAPTDAMVLHADAIKLGGPGADDPIARKSDLQDLKDIISTVSDAAGANAALHAALVTGSWPVCSSKVKAE